MKKKTKKTFSLVIRKRVELSQYIFENKNDDFQCASGWWLHDAHDRHGHRINIILYTHTFSFGSLSTKQASAAAKSKQRSRRVRQSSKVTLTGSSNAIASAFLSFRFILFFCSFCVSSRHAQYNIPPVCVCVFIFVAFTIQIRVENSYVKKPAFL